MVDALEAFSLLAEKLDPPDQENAAVDLVLQQAREPAEAWA